MEILAGLAVAASLVTISAGAMVAIWSNITLGIKIIATGILITPAVFMCIVAREALISMKEVKRCSDSLPDQDHKEHEE